MITGERDERQVDDDGVDQPADRGRRRRRGRSCVRAPSPGRRRGCAGAVGRGRRRGRRPAPRHVASRQSVNPPVDAPASSTTSPVTSMANVLEGGVELVAPAADEARRRSLDDQRVAGGDEARRLVGDRAVDEHRARRRSPRGVGRLTTRPRRTSSASSRRRAGTQPAGGVGAVVAAAFLAGAFRAGAFRAGAFFGRRLLGRRLLRRGLLRRSLLGRRLLRRGLLRRRLLGGAPSWPAPSWPLPSWRAPSWPLPSSQAPSSPGRGRRAGGCEPGDEGLELILDVVDAVGEPAELLGDLLLDGLGDARSRSRYRGSSRFCTVASASDAADLARLDEPLHRRLGLLA